MNNLKILIIDDDSQMREMLRQMLELENHQVVTAIHGMGLLVCDYRNLPSADAAFFG